MRLPAEWEIQSGIQLTWPHENTDWGYMLKEVQACFVRIAYEIACRELLLVVTPAVKDVRIQLEHGGVDMRHVVFVTCDTNDTWARDHGAITLVDEEGGRVLLDFAFNGWGLKFAADKDNLITRQLCSQGALRGAYINRTGFVLEGGSIETDGKGTLLTTSECLLSPNRNGEMIRKDIEDYLCKTLNQKRILWLDYGSLQGDDTDSHVDTLARMCPGDTIAYVRCTDKTDSHYESLRKMEEQLRSFRTLSGEPYHLLLLPFPDRIDDENGYRLPATYANFLVMNGAVLYPTYAQPDNDKLAGEVLKQAFPHRDIVGVDCRALIRQHGSLHCVTMQYPTGVIAWV